MTAANNLCVISALFVLPQSSAAAFSDHEMSFLHSCHVHADQARLQKPRFDLASPPFPPQLNRVTFVVSQERNKFLEVELPFCGGATSLPVSIGPFGHRRSWKYFASKDPNFPLQNSPTVAAPRIRSADAATLPRSIAGRPALTENQVRVMMAAAPRSRPSRLLATPGARRLGVL
jgi:hypothetical protein